MASLIDLAHLFLDSALIITSTYFVIAGTTQPKPRPSSTSTSSASSSSSSTSSTAPPTDLISQLGLTKLPRFLPLIFLALALIQGRTLGSATLREGAPPLTKWIESGDRGRFRLAAVLAAVGGAGRLWCYKVLGEWFTFDLATRKGQKIVKTGPYSFVRHPSYTAVLVLSLGFFMMNGPYSPLMPLEWRTYSIYGVGVLMTLTAALIVKRINDEERMFLMDKDLGKEYFQFMVTTPHRLWPSLY